LLVTRVCLDHALAAFLDDLEARGLSDNILLVACGEMGRTPRLNKAGGRDHWGNLGPLLLAGAGLPRGQVLGASARLGGEPASEPVRIRHLLGIILDRLLDVGKLRVQRGMPRQLLTMAEYPSIAGIS
jgi:uncharacterized protein (DUF1501 family)